MAEELGVPYLSAIPLDPEIMASSDEGIPIVLKSPDSVAGSIYLELARALTQGAESTRTEVAEPTQVQIKNDGKALHLTWPEGFHTELSALALRAQCPCASCVDENTGKRTLDESRIPKEIQITQNRTVGRYALALNFSDGHRTGIYSYLRLKKMLETSSSPLRSASGSASVHWTPGGSAPTSPPGEPMTQTSSPHPASPTEIIRKILDEKINPAVAAHGGHIDLVEFREQVAYIRLSGGCQGCGLSSQTVKDGFEVALRREIPSLVSVIDITDHAGGTHPWVRVRTTNN